MTLRRRPADAVTSKTIVEPKLDEVSHSPRWDAVDFALRGEIRKGTDEFVDNGKGFVRTVKNVLKAVVVTISTIFRPSAFHEKLKAFPISLTRGAFDALKAAGLVIAGMAVALGVVASNSGSTAPKPRVAVTAPSTTISSTSTSTTQVKGSTTTAPKGGQPHNHHTTTTTTVPSTTGPSSTTTTTVPGSTTTTETTTTVPSTTSTTVPSTTTTTVPSTTSTTTTTVPPTTTTTEPTTTTLPPPSIG